MGHYYQIVHIKLPKDFTGRKNYCRQLVSDIQSRFLKLQATSENEAYFDDEGVHVTVPVPVLEFKKRITNIPQLLPLLMGHLLMSMMRTDVKVNLEIDLLVGFVKRIDHSFKLAQVHLSQTPTDKANVIHWPYGLPQVTAPILTVGMSTPENTMTLAPIDNMIEAVSKIQMFFEQEGGYVMDEFVPSHRTIN